ncbi:MAG: recombinase family protein [Nocardioides sp.]|nr:recombinase family protein [Nocardioides sp.]
MPPPTSASRAAAADPAAAKPRRSRTPRRKRASSLLGEGSETRPARVATYKRASTDEGNQPYSLEAQQMRIDAFLLGRPEWTVVAEYEERASAKDIEGRPQMLRLLDDAARDKFDIVLVARLDRWSRSLIDVLDTVEELDEVDVSLASCTEQFDTRTAVGRLLLSLLGTFAEFERATIIDRIERGNRAKLQRGIPLSSRVGYGLTIDTDGKTIADPATIGIVERIYAEYTAGTHGFRAIADRLNQDHVPAPRGPRWSPQSIGNILKNRGFVGEVKHKGSWLPGTHSPILDPQLLAAAQTLLSKRTSSKRSPSTVRGDFVLTGLITCGHCGGAYVGTSGTGKNKVTIRYYSCGTARRYGSKTCGAPHLPAQELEHLVTEALLEVYRDNALFEEAIAKHLVAQQSRREPLERELASLRKSLAEKERVLNRYRDDYEAERLSADRYETRSAELEADIGPLTVRIAALELELGSSLHPTAPSADELAVMRDHLVAGVRHGSAAARKAVFNALVEGLEVHDRDDIRPTFRVYDPAAAKVLGARNS